MWNNFKYVFCLFSISLLLTSCAKKTVSFSIENFKQSQAKTEQEVISELGAGEEVDNSYTKSVIESHKLPANT